jgi:hypothetical protein
MAPLRQREVKEATEAKGLAWATVRRAKDALRIVTKKSHILMPGIGSGVCR